MRKQGIREPRVNTRRRGCIPEFLSKESTSRWRGVVAKATNATMAHPILRCEKSPRPLLTVPLKDPHNGGNRADYNKVGASSTINRRLPTSTKLQINNKIQVYQTQEHLGFLVKP